MGSFCLISWLEAKLSEYYPNSPSATQGSSTSPSSFLIFLLEAGGNREQVWMCASLCVTWNGLAESKGYVCVRTLALGNISFLAAPAEGWGGIENLLGWPLTAEVRYCVENGVPGQGDWDTSITSWPVSLCNDTADSSQTPQINHSCSSE